MEKIYHWRLASCAYAYTRQLDLLYFVLMINTNVRWHDAWHKWYADTHTHIYIYNHSMTRPRWEFSKSKVTHLRERGKIIVFVHLSFVILFYICSSFVIFFFLFNHHNHISQMFCSYKFIYFSLSRLVDFILFLFLSLIFFIILDIYIYIYLGNIIVMYINNK